MHKNLLLVGYKPIFVSSNHYLSSLKRKYKIKSGGYLGTLDPFAKGAMIIAFGQYTKLLPHLKKEKKVYRATLWLGALSESLDIENILEIKEVPSFDISRVQSILDSLLGTIAYTPPKFSAKHIQGQRAYDLARRGVEFELPKCEMQIFDIKLLSYTHPFLSFEVSVSSGAYVRSIGEMIANALGVNGVLSMLERIEDGGFRVRNREEMVLDPLKALDYPILENLSNDIKDKISKGQKFHLKNLENGLYVTNFDDFFSIIEVKKDASIRYILNRMIKC